MHWCVNINALQRPFSSDFFLLSWLLPSPEESVSSVKYHFLLFRLEVSQLSLLFGHRQQPKREEREDVERQWVEYDFTFQLPPGSLTLYIKHSTSAILHLVILYPVTICIRCAIKPFYVSYLHTTGREKHLLAIWPRDPVWSLSRELTGLGPEGMKGWMGVGLPLDFKWRVGAV